LGIGGKVDVSFVFVVGTDGSQLRGIARAPVAGTVSAARLVTAGNINHRVSHRLLKRYPGIFQHFQVIEFAHELFGGAQTSPTAVNAESCRIHFTADGGLDNEGGPAIGLRIHPVEGNREDDFSGGVVIGHEVMGILGFQGVSGADHLVQVSDGFGIFPGSGINLGIQVKLGQQHPGRSLVSMAVFAFRRKQFPFDILEFAFQIGKKLRTADLLGEEGTHAIFFSDERYVSEEVDGVVVAKSAQEAGFSTVRLDLVADIPRDVSLVEFGRSGLTDEFVTCRHLVEYTVIEGTYETVRGRPVHIVQITQGGVVPPDQGFVGGEFLKVEIAAEVLAETFVHAADITPAGWSLLTAQRKPRIQLGQYVDIILRILINTRRSHFVFIKRQGVKVSYTARKGDGHRRKGYQQIF